MKIFNFFFSFIISAITIYSQPDWSVLRQTEIPVANAISYDIFTNRLGSHIIVQNSTSLIYYRINVLGEILNTYSIWILPTGSRYSIISPSICGTENNIYVVYRLSNENNVIVNYSTNGGISWDVLTSISPSINVTSVESIFSKNKLHIVYELNGDIYRRYYNFENNSWSAQANVSPNDQWTYSSPRIGVGMLEMKIKFILHIIESKQMK